MRKNIRKIIAAILFFIIIFILLILLRSANWFLKNFRGVEFATAVYQIFSPLKGTEAELLKDYCRECLYPAIYVPLLLLLVFNLIGILLKKLLPELESYFEPEGIDKLVIFIKGIIVCAMIVFLITQIWKKAVIIDIPGYIESVTNSSTLYETEYVSPDKVSIEFPANKRNLILIYMESMETTYASKEAGGVNLLITYRN